MKVSVVMPIYNERDYIGRIIDRVPMVSIPWELIIVDDGSTDGTREILKKLIDEYEGPISYSGRTYIEGKKINWKDGVAALWWLLRYRFVE